MRKAEDKEIKIGLLFKGDKDEDLDEKNFVGAPGERGDPGPGIAYRRHYCRASW
jgi:hypothetical protein